MARRPTPGAHEALLEAARVEIGRHGLDRARVEDMARRAGVSKGAFYLHFRTKEEAFDAIVQRFLGALEEQTRRRKDAEERFAHEHGATSGPELLRAQIDFECGLDAESLELMWRNRKVLRALDTAGPAYADTLVEFRRRMGAELRARIADKQAAGGLRRDIDPAVVADLLLGTYEGFARRMNDLDRKPDLYGWTRSLLVILYEGMLDPAARRRRAAPPRAPRAHSDPPVKRRAR